MTEKIESIHKGTIGWFWPGVMRPRSWRKNPERGYLRLGDDNRLHLVALDESVNSTNWHDLHQAPRIITGATEVGGLILLDFTGIGRTMSLGGPNASVMRYYARSLIADVDIRKIRSEKVRSVSAHLFGISAWLGISSVTEEWINDRDTNRRSSFSIKVDSSSEQAVAIHGGREIAVATHCRVRGDPDRRTVLAPISITCRSKFPKGLAHLRYPLLRIQDLISFAYDGFVPAEGGQAVPDMNEELDAAPQLWDTFLMTAMSDALPPKDRDLPYFHCSDISGVAGLRRWVQLCHDYMRAVRPVVERYRQGKASPPLRLMEVAAGIEYWVAANRSTAQWARRMCKRRRHECGYAWTLAAHVGRHFGDWIDDPDAWAHEFWSTYNKLKHVPGYSADEYKLSRLAESGRLLLAAARARQSRPLLVLAVQ